MDGEWRCAQDQPRCLDSVGNENNCIEVEEAEQPEEMAVGRSRLSFSLRAAARAFSRTLP